jgi:hypothetical protein
MLVKNIRVGLLIAAPFIPTLTFGTARGFRLGANIHACSVTFEDHRET